MAPYGGLLAKDHRVDRALNELLGTLHDIFMLWCPQTL